MSDYYHDDPVQEAAVRRILPKFIAGSLLMLFSFVYYQTTLAANINLNSNSSIEFGQGVSVAAACAGSDNLTVIPKSTFENMSGSGGSYYLSTVNVSGIPASCNGKDFSLSFYDSVTGSSALPIFSNLFGENQRVATVYNSAGYFLNGFQSSGTEVSSDSGAFTVTFKTPVALSTNTMKVTLETTRHKDWAEASISGSATFTCALLNSSGVKCWGRNAEGQIGIGGSSAPVQTPVDVSGLRSGVTTIATGGTTGSIGRHACAVLDTGTVKCWGWNGNGQLGIGTNTNESANQAPVTVIGLPARAVAVAAGYDHTCILLINGAVECAGGGYRGQLGNNGTVDKLSPEPVSNITNAVAISAGGHNTCALLRTGAVQCWGLNTSAQLGNGSIGGQSNIPVGVSGLTSGVKAIATGETHSCALLSTGEVNCWGLNTSGQLGTGTVNPHYAPERVSGITNAVAISAGVSHTCALLSTGAVQCWGENGDGQLGDNTTVDKTSPVGVTGLTSSVRAIGTGLNHSCAILNTGAARCWGSDGEGQLGNGAGSSSNTPVAVSNFP